MADTPPTSKYQRIAPLLERQPTDPDKPVALLTCGLAGSGKSTLSKTVVTCAPHFTRLSVDEIVGEKHGLYGVDYPADEDLYDKYLDEAGVIYVERLAALLEAGKDVVLDRSFWAKKDRDEFKKRVEDAGGRWVLVYFKVGDKEALWQRIQDRSAQAKTANSAFHISRDTFEMYWSGFEEPRGEGEVVFQVLPAETRDE